MDAQATIFDLLFMVLFIVLSFVSRKGLLPAWGQDYANGNERLLNTGRSKIDILDCQSDRC